MNKKIEIGNGRGIMPPSMKRIKLRAASELMRLDLRLFKIWCVKYGVTIHTGIGPAFVLEDDLHIGSNRQVEGDMKKKWGNAWENILETHQVRPEISNQFINKKEANLKIEQKIKLSAEAKKFSDYLERKTNHAAKNS
jgi:hypothetical protein